MKKAIVVLLVLIISFTYFSGCAKTDPSVKEEEPYREVATAEELLHAVEDGNTRIRFTASIDLAKDMLKQQADMQSLSIDGNGHTLSGTGACVIRLEKGCVLDLQNITIVSEQDGIGILEDATVGGSNCIINAKMNALHAVGTIQIASDSELELNAEQGASIDCSSLKVLSHAKVQCVAQKQSIVTDRGNLYVFANAQLTCEANGYNVIKVGGTLSLKEGARVDITNTGDYNGGEIGTLETVGIATIVARGGDKGVGLFIAELPHDVEVKGSCKPQALYEAGDGELTFIPIEESET